jgi:hypothetical protein
MPSVKVDATVEELRAAHAQILEGITAYEREGRATPETRRSATKALRVLERRLTQSPKSEREEEIEQMRAQVAPSSHWAYRAKPPCEPQSVGARASRRSGSRPKCSRRALPKMRSFRSGRQRGP